MNHIPAAASPGIVNFIEMVLILSVIVAALGVLLYLTTEMICAILERWEEIKRWLRK